ncbi:MAG TPA: PQQ-binding-like beta-propeller repeat protein [Rhizomicrobium sp.]|nr:PQQ-binding-like beta-propeller repeat protein [Rhizomicrobium sp.]
MATRRNLLLSALGGVLSWPLRSLAQTGMSAGTSAADTEWRYYAADLANTRYSPLDQISATNFDKLQVAWQFHTDALGPRPEYVYEGTPLCIKGRLYITAGTRRDAVCLNAATGELIWMHSIDEGERANNAPRQYSGHGVAYWTDGQGDERILYVTLGYQLVALDARTGEPVRSFGENGVVDLKKDDDQSMDLITAAVGLHATPVVGGNTVIVGAAHPGGTSASLAGAVKGYVRGFDVHTGKRKWIFHNIPRRGEFGYDTWLKPEQTEAIGNTGCWGQISIDLELNTAYLPIELPTGDQVGIYRAGPGLFGESLVAVDLDTGKRKWHYQTIHHGLWDRDIPCAPILCDIPHNGKVVRALAQPSKQTFLYVLDRETGKPVWPIPETQAPAGDVPGEWYSPTQPIPSKPPAYGVQSINPKTIINFTKELHDRALKLISHYRTGGVYEPPSIGTVDGSWGTLCAPGFTGGTNWPGGCYDPETRNVYVYCQNTATTASIVPGDPKITDFSYTRGTPGAAQAPAQAMGSVKKNADAEGPASTDGLRPGRITIDGLPLLKPPYGAISAINLEKGDIVWQIAHGETPDFIRNHPALKGLTIPRTGQIGIVGPMVTRALVVCGESGVNTTASGKRGAMLRAYDKNTGEDRGAVYMPAAQTGSPMTYMLGGRQHIVLAIGGGGVPASLIAFRLPQA